VYRVSNFLIHSNVKLRDPFESQLALFSIMRTGSRMNFGSLRGRQRASLPRGQQLGFVREEVEDDVNLIFDTTLLLDGQDITYRRHSVCLVKDKRFNVVRTESTVVLDHVQSTSRVADDNEDTFSCSNTRRPDIPILHRIGSIV
jgi:hypothetical protein